MRIVVAPPDVLLAMKLLAGRGRRDLPDLGPPIGATGGATEAEVAARCSLGETEQREGADLFAVENCWVG